MRAAVILSILPTLVISQSPPLSTFLPYPTKVPCPTDIPLIRSSGTGSSQTLSQAEQSYISSRTQNVLPDAWKTYIQNVKAVSSDPLPDYVLNIAAGGGPVPKVGIATSGGSLRATLFGSGVVSSLDGRNQTAKALGTGGLLQATTYIAGLSGGSWLVGSLAQANFPTIPDLIFPPPPPPGTNTSSVFGGFLLGFDILTPEKDLVSNIAYISTLIDETRPKYDVSHFPATVSDIWGRGLARHFVNGTTAQDVTATGNHGGGILFSGIANVPTFASHQQPFPIVVVDTLPPNPDSHEIVPETFTPLDSEVWEFSPFEAGSFDGNLTSFIPTQLLGSTDPNNCIVGFDQASFILAMSSNIWNELNATSSIPQLSPIAPVITAIGNAFPKDNVRLDSAAVPNPFKGLNPGKYSNSDQDFVTFVDGGEDGEVIPILPMLVPARKVEVIILIDASSDTTDNFANGKSVIITAERSNLLAGQYPFPAGIPANPAVFAQNGLTTRPAFFGCNDSVDVPLLVYIANGGPPANGAPPVTNAPSTKLSFTNDQTQAIVDQAFQVATQGINGTQWGTCLACAVVDRTRAKMGVPRSGVCSTCFDKYCFVDSGKNGPLSSGGVGRDMRAVTGAVVLGLAAAWASAAFWY